MDDTCQAKQTILEMSDDRKEKVFFFLVWWKKNQLKIYRRCQKLQKELKPRYVLAEKLGFDSH